MGSLMTFSAISPASHPKCLCSNHSEPLVVFHTSILILTPLSEVLLSSSTLQIPTMLQNPDGLFPSPSIFPSCPQASCTIPHSSVVMIPSCHLCCPLNCKPLEGKQLVLLIVCLSSAEHNVWRKVCV